MNIFEKILTQINSLPTLPTIYSALSEALDNPNTSSDKLAKIISTDQASAFKILKVVNSPFYGFRGKIETISQAILYLGFNEVKNIVFALSVINFFSKDKRLPNFRPLDFWGHSIGVGVAARAIGRVIGSQNLENYFLAGIFHDIGKLIFFEFAYEEYADVLKIVENEGCCIKDAEMEIFGLDHARAGKLLAAKWKLPSGIQDSIYYHHSGIIPGEKNQLVAAVHIGNIVARILSLGYAGDIFIPEPNLDVWEILKIPHGFFTQNRKSIEREFENTIQYMFAK